MTQIVNVMNFLYPLEAGKNEAIFELTKECIKKKNDFKSFSMNVHNVN